MQRRDDVGGITASGTFPLAGYSGTAAGGSRISGEASTNNVSVTLTIQGHRASL